MNVSFPALRMLLAPACLFLGNCSYLANNVQQTREQRPPATDPVIGRTALLANVARSTALSALRQPVTTAKLGAKVLWHRPRELIFGNIPFDLQLSPAPVEIPGSPEFEMLLDQRQYPPSYPGSLKWLVDGKEFFSELNELTDNASKTIGLQIYIFDNDDVAVRYADKLKLKSHEIGVRVLFDDMGSALAQTSPPATPAPAGFVPPADMAAYLRANSSVQVRESLNPWLVADHSKLFVFDDETALMGGMNIGREYFSEWHDLMVRVDGPIVGQLAMDFSRTWKRAGAWGDLALLRRPRPTFPPPPAAGQFPMRILRTDPADGRYEILNSTLLAIRAARSRIWIQSPYVANDDVALALETAARNGVDVRLIIPFQSDSAIMDAGNAETARRILSGGGKVYQYPRMTHMKVMVFDGWASVGSANLDTLSLRINRELNLGFSDPATIRRLEQRVFLPDFRASRKMKMGDRNVSPIAEIIADQL